jgi:hypothetical protein
MKEECEDIDIVTLPALTGCSTYVTNINHVHDSPVKCLLELEILAQFDSHCIADIWCNETTINPLSIPKATRCRWNGIRSHTGTYFTGWKVSTAEIEFSLVLTVS